MGLRRGPAPKLRHDEMARVLRVREALFADDIKVSAEMCAWSDEEIFEFFESGGQRRPARMLKELNLALVWACSDGDAREAERLLASRADVNAAGQNGICALTRACLRDHEGCVELLLSHGADVDQGNGSGTTPLMYACMRGHEPICKLLCCAGASRDAVDKNGLSPISLAHERHPRKELAAWLERSRGWTTPLHYLEVITATRALALLRAGVELSSSGRSDGGGDGGDGAANTKGAVKAAITTPAIAAPAAAPSPLDLATALAREGRAPAGSAAALVLGWRHSRMLALAMGSHARLGAESGLLKLDAELLEMIALTAS